MGRFMRRFWVPVMPSFRLVADASPERIRLLGENLVAFRISDGRVGVFDEGCPHRGVSLALARNADCALTCIFHGWKFDVSGKVLDVPPEPPDRRAAFAARVKVRAYPVRETAGMVFAWMGEGEPAPFPAFNWTSLPASHVYVTTGIVQASWLNGLEGQLDSAHVGILHSDWVSRGADFGKNNIDRTTHDLAPRFEFEDQPYGYREAAVRKMPDGGNYVRVREFVMPWYSYIPQQGGRSAPQLMTISVPMDDETSMQWDVRYTLDAPIDMSRILGVQLAPHMDARRSMGSIDQRFGQDRAKVSAGAWTGFVSVRHEDYAVAMAQGAIPDREREHLSISDLSVVRARRRLRQAVQEHGQGAPHVSDDATIDWSLVRSFAEIIPADGDWRALPRG
jgi:nitrite reductase/ring-hydroxylating ferredoxin subunit